MIIATNNKGKIKEIKDILKIDSLYSLKDKNINIDVIEDMDTFEGNAIKKAKEIYEISKETVIADDSGLCISALDDFPGVLTHRFLGEDATDKQRNEYLIREVDKHKNREAKVVCVLAYYDGKNTITAEGVLNGKISKKCRGTNGFGFDEIFETKEGLTLAELTEKEKNKISARALAAKELKDKLKLIL